MKRILIFILALITILAFCGTASASGNIDGKKFDRYGSSIIKSVYNKSRSEITTAMSPYGDLQGFNRKSVALVNPSVYCTVDRVWVYVLNSSDYALRIDPNYTSNWVGPNKTNISKQVKAVQTNLFYMNYYNGPIDGLWGTKTDTAIKNFQADCNLPADGIVGPNTWRALCSAQWFTYGSSIFGSVN